MAQTFTSLLTHNIFGTKDRVASIRPELQSDLHAYLVGIIRNLEGQALIVNGAADHVHLLVWLPPTLAIAEALRVLKANASRWVHENQGCRSKRKFRILWVQARFVPASAGSLAFGRRGRTGLRGQQGEREREREAEHVSGQTPPALGRPW